MFSDPHLVPREANYQPLTPLSFLDRALQVWPHQPALAWRGDRWSYAEFGDLVFRMIAWLREQGVKQGDVVSVVLTNRPETLAAHFAIPALGAVLNTINTRVSGEEIAYIVDHAQSALLICEPATKAVVPELDIPVTMLCSSVGDADGENFFEGAVKPVDLLSKIENETQPVAVNYTSGTTGKPKGVVYTHRGAYLNAIGNTLEMEFTTSSRYLWTLPMFHCNGWCFPWSVSYAAGTHVCLRQVRAGGSIELAEGRDLDVRPAGNTVEIEGDLLLGATCGAGPDALLGSVFTVDGITFDAGSSLTTTIAAVDDFGRVDALSAMFGGGVPGETAGDLVIELADGYSASLGDRFLLVAAGSVLGDGFATITVDGLLPAGFFFEQFVDATGVGVRVVPAPAGLTIIGAGRMIAVRRRRS